MYFYRILTTTNSPELARNYDIIFDACKLQSIKTVRREPSDDSEDPGGIVTLDELGYKTMARDVSRHDLSKYIEKSNRFYTYVRATENDWKTQLEQCVARFNEDYVVGGLGIYLGRHTPFSDDEMFQLRPKWGADEARYESVCSVELSFEGYAPEDVFRPQLAETGFVQEWERCIGGFMQGSATHVFCRPG